jgi:hypothetical protein
MMEQITGYSELIIGIDCKGKMRATYGQRAKHYLVSHKQLKTWTQQE